ncbi:MAG: gliding motility-associated C-terminal domain-containing protein [Saprospiraceae bacterium]
MRPIDQNQTLKEIRIKAGFIQWVGLISGIFFLNGLYGQAPLFEVITNYAGCDSVGTIRVVPHNDSIKYRYEIKSNECGYLLRSAQDSGIFSDLKPCTYTIIVKDAQGDSIYSENIKLGFKIVSHATFPCEAIITNAVSQIKVTGGLAESYSIPLSRRIILETPDSVFSITGTSTFMGQLIVYDGCGHSDTTKLDNRGMILKEILCDENLYSIPLPKTTYDQTYLKDTVFFEWILNGNLISTENFVRFKNQMPDYILFLNAKSRGCIIKDSVILQNEPSRKISLTIKADRQVLCNEDSVLLKADVAVSLPVRFGWNTKDSSDEISVYTAGKYQVIATTDEGCSDTAEILIRHSSLSLTAQVTPNLCFSEAKGNIDLVVAGGIIPYSYTWSDSVKAKDRQNLGNGSYRVLLIDSAGCALSDSFIITSPPPMSLTLSAYAADCEPARNGRVTTMMNGGVPPYRYQWSNGLTVPNVDTLSPGSYSITIFDQNQCSVFFPFLIDDLNPLQSFPRDTICANGSLKVGQSVYTKTGRYKDSLISSKGCDSVVTTYLVVNEPVDFAFTKKDPSCNGVKDGSVTITDAIGYVDYDVYLNEQLYVPAQLSALAPGNYVIKLKDRFGCFKEKGFAMTNPPLIDFDLGGDKTITFGDTLSVTPMTNLTPGNIQQITWATDLPQPNCIFCNAIYKYKPSDDHYLKATIESITGCKVSDEIRITLDRDFKVFVPNIFSPGSGRFSENQYLKVYGGSQVSKINYFRIFNRFGDLVFEATDFLPNDTGYAWDGLFKGANAAPGVYIYVAEVSFADGSVRVVKGDITLVR